MAQQETQQALELLLGEALDGIQELGEQVRLGHVEAGRIPLLAHELYHRISRGLSMAVDPRPGPSVRRTHYGRCRICQEWAAHEEYTDDTTRCVSCGATGVAVEAM